MKVRVRVSERVNGNVHKQMSVNEGRRKMKAADLKIRKWDVPRIKKNGKTEQNKQKRKEKMKTEEG